MPLIMERLERLPFSTFHRRLLVMGGLGYSFDAMDSAILAFALPVLITRWSLSSVHAGALASATYIGYFFGALAAGAAGDIIGRRIVMMWALATYSLASFASAFAPSSDTFFVLRILAGVGTGAESAIVAPFLSEFVGKQYRGRFIGALAGFFSFGFLASALLGYVLIPAAPWGWQLAIVITAMPIVLLLWWRRALPESPRWLESQGRHTEADVILSRIEDEIVGAQGAPLPSPEPMPIMPTAGPTSVLRNVRSLWSPPMARISAMIWILWISITFSYYSFFTWIPTLMIERGMTITKSFGYSLAIYAAQVPGYYSAASINDRIGRRATIVTYMLFGSASAIALAAATSNAWAVIASIALSFFMNGTYAGVYAYTAEVFPTPIRTTGAGLASAVGRLGAIGAPILVGFLFPILGFPGVFGITTLILLAGAVVVLLLGVRTRGLSLEAIAIAELKSCD
jgi:MFS transporter, putative metabolite:H+ symporter